MVQRAFGTLRDAQKKRFYVDMDLMYEVLTGIHKKALSVLDHAIHNNLSNCGTQKVANVFLPCRPFIRFIRCKWLEVGYHVNCEVFYYSRWKQ